MRAIACARSIVEGRKNTPREVLLGSLGVHMGQPLLAIDPVDMKKRLQSLGWIRSATVERRLPDALYVRITEDYPAALWQQSGTFRLIDRDGHLISDVDVAALRPAAGAWSAPARRSTPPICSTCWRASPISRAGSAAPPGWASGAGTCISTMASTSSCRRIRRRRLVAAGPARARAEPARPGYQRHRHAPAGPPRGPAWPGGRAAPPAGQRHLGGRRHHA